MSKITLHYFDSPGRAEPIRDAFRIGKIEFTDNRMSYPQYGEFKAAGKAPTGVPVLEIDGKLIGQSNAILAFAGKKAKLYPTDDLEALQVDEVLAAVEDLIASMAHTFYMPDSEKAAERQKLFADDGKTTRYVKYFEEKVKAAGGAYAVAGKLTVADLKLAGTLGMLASGTLDGVPATLLEDKYPTLHKYLASITKEVAEKKK